MPLAAALAGGASHVGFIFFAEKPAQHRAGRSRPAARGRRRQGEGRRRDGRCRRRIRSTRSSQAMSPDMLQLHGAETPERVAAVKARYGLPVMKAFSGPRGRRSRRASSPIAASPTVSCSTPSRRRARNFRAATASPSTGGCLPASTRSVDYMLSGGLNAANIGEALAARQSARHRHLVGRGKRAGRQGSGADRQLSSGPFGPRGEPRRLKWPRQFTFCPGKA